MDGGKSYEVDWDCILMRLWAGLERFGVSVEVDLERFGAFLSVFEGLERFGDEGHPEDGPGGRVPQPFSLFRAEPGATLAKS